MGRQLAGKTTLAKYMAQTMDYTLIDMKSIRDDVKKSMGTEEEPFEGEVPIEKVEEATVKKVTQLKGKIIFDGLIQTDGEAQIKFLENFGLPNFVLCLTAGEKADVEEKEIQ
jgi:shikimate kinase